MRYQVILETTEEPTPGSSGSDAMGWDVFSLTVLAFRACPGVTVVSADAVSADVGPLSSANHS